MSAAKQSITYHLLTEVDGLTYIYEGAERHSRFGIRPADKQEQRLLDAVIELLNTGYTDVRLQADAFAMYVQRLW